MANTRILLGPTGQGATTRLLPGSNQEYLGHSSAEHVQSQVILMGDGIESGHGESLPWQFCQRPGSRENLVGREGAGVVRIGVDDIRGGLQAHAVYLHINS